MSAASQARARETAFGGLRRFLAELPPVAAIAAVVLLAYIAIAATGPLWAPYGPAEVLVGDPFEAPSLQHLLGTDNLGRDVFSRVVYGSRPVLAMAAAGLGYAFMPKHLAMHPSVVAVPLIDPEFWRDLLTACREGDEQSIAILRRQGKLLFCGELIPMKR